MGRAIDLFITYRFIRLLTTPFNKQEAYKLGIIDENGTRTDKEIETPDEKSAYTILHKLVFNLWRADWQSQIVVWALRRHWCGHARTVHGMAIWHGHIGRRVSQGHRFDVVRGEPPRGLRWVNSQTLSISPLTSSHPERPCHPKLSPMIRPDQSRDTNRGADRPQTLVLRHLARNN